MNIKKLTIKQVKEIYNQYIVEDFPINERRPLNKIIKLINNNKYITFALFNQDTLLGYAFFYGYDNQFICDYFAIIKEHRNQNYGSFFLQELLKLFSTSKLYFEVEKPENPNKSIKERRIQFYLKNNIILNPIHIRLFFVDYIILSNTPTTLEEVKHLYQKLYNRFAYNQYIEFK